MLKVQKFLLTLIILVDCNAFLTPSHTLLTPKKLIAFTSKQRIKESCLHETERTEEAEQTKPKLPVKDMSKSGNRRGRLNKLAELEEDMVETDKSFILKATGGFVALLLVLLVAAFASGVIDPV